MSPRILVVEDDAELAQLLVRRLRSEGFDADHEADGDAAVAAVAARPYEVVVLDVGLPGRNGWDVCRAIRPQFGGAILFLTARDDELDQVLGLELGGDDYVVKPVSSRVLIARIRALLRRHGPVEVGTSAMGPFVVDRQRREVRAGGAVVPLTTAEFDLVAFLSMRAGQDVDRLAIYETLLGIEYDGLDRTVDVQVARVRQKLAAAHPRGRDVIRTVRGIGYLAVPGDV